MRVAAHAGCLPFLASFVIATRFRVGVRVAR